MSGYSIRALSPGVDTGCTERHAGSGWLPGESDSLDARPFRPAVGDRSNSLVKRFFGPPPAAAVLPPGLLKPTRAKACLTYAAPGRQFASTLPGLFPKPVGHGCSVAREVPCSPRRRARRAPAVPCPHTSQEPSSRLIRPAPLPLPRTPDPVLSSPPGERGNDHGTVAVRLLPHSRPPPRTPPFPGGLPRRL